MTEYEEFVNEQYLDVLYSEGEREAAALGLSPSYGLDYEHDGAFAYIKHNRVFLTSTGETLRGEWKPPIYFCPHARALSTRIMLRPLMFSQQMWRDTILLDMRHELWHVWQLKNAIRMYDEANHTRCELQADSYAFKKVPADLAWYSHQYYLWGELNGTADADVMKAAQMVIDSYKCLRHATRG